MLTVRQMGIEKGHCEQGYVPLGMVCLQFFIERSKEQYRVKDLGLAQKPKL